MIKLLGWRFSRDTGRIFADLLKPQADILAPRDSFASELYNYWSRRKLLSRFKWLLEAKRDTNQEQTERVVSSVSKHNSLLVPRVGKWRLVDATRASGQGGYRGRCPSSHSEQNGIS